MNKIIKQRIEEAANITVQNLYDYAKQTRNPKVSAYSEGYLDAIDVQGDFLFIEGANYALSNQWISVDDALPEFEGNFSDYYIIKTENGGCAVTIYYRTSEKEYWWNFEKVKVTHWMEIPKLKGGEK